jgi:hypothetical protein
MESALQLIRFQHKAYQLIISLVGRVQRGEFARAEEVRTIADGMRDPACKRTMLDVAISYDKLAERAEARRRGQPESKLSK